MHYIDGFMMGVPIANKQKCITHLKLGDSVFMALRASRVVNC